MESFCLQLFQRSNKGVTLTEAGETFKAYAQRIVNTWEELEGKMGLYSNALKGRIIVGATSGVGE